MQQLVADLREKLATVKKGGGEAAVKRHKERGKMFVRERVEALLDPDTPFLETSAIAANGMYNDERPGSRHGDGHRRDSGPSGDDRGQRCHRQRRKTTSR